MVSGISDIFLTADTAAAEPVNAAYLIDILSNGFKPQPPCRL
jgi:hypothetical protein